jgi:hypothetical protein
MKTVCITLLSLAPIPNELWVFVRFFNLPHFFNLPLFYQFLNLSSQQISTSYGGRSIFWPVKKVADLADGTMYGFGGKGRQGREGRRRKYTVG